MYLPTNNMTIIDISLYLDPVTIAKIEDGSLLRLCNELTTWLGNYKARKNQDRALQIKYVQVKYIGRLVANELYLRLPEMATYWNLDNYGYAHKVAAKIRIDFLAKLSER